MCVCVCVRVFVLPAEHIFSSYESNVILQIHIRLCLGIGARLGVHFQYRGRFFPHGVINSGEIINVFFGV